MKRKDILYTVRLRNRGLSKHAIKKATTANKQVSLTNKEVDIVLFKMKEPTFLFGLSPIQFERLYKYADNLEALSAYLSRKQGKKITVLGLRDVAHKNNIKRDASTRKPPANQIVNADIEAKVCKGYLAGKASQTLAMEYGFKNKRSILQILERNKISRRTSEDRREDLSYGKFSFERIDSEEKAYFLGLLLTDGYVIDSRGYVGIDLVDKDAMDLLSKTTGRELLTIESKKPNHQTKYRIVLYGRTYLEQLRRLGVTPRKTFTTAGAKLEAEESIYIPWIIRGIIDGDGWIRKDGKEFFISSASSEFLEWVKREMELLGFNNLSIQSITNEYNGYYTIRNASKENISVLKEKVYSQEFGMNRKYKRLHQDGRSETIIRGA